MKVVDPNHHDGISKSDKLTPPPTLNKNKKIKIKASH